MKLKEQLQPRNTRSTRKASDLPQQSNASQPWRSSGFVFVCLVYFVV